MPIKTTNVEIRNGQKMIEEIIESIKNKAIKVVSFDIFDTLVFRCVREPKEIFTFMYRYAPALFPAYMNEDEWREARLLAEQIARKSKKNETGNEEVTLLDIYNSLPNIFTRKEEIMSCEIETEKKYLQLNKDIYDTIYRLKSAGYKVILCSDMYLSLNNIMELLKSVAFDFSYIDKIYISSEVGKNKKTGEMFDYVVADLSIDYTELYHCGDNLANDIGQPFLKGIPTFYYSVFSEAEYIYPFFFLEQEKSSDKIDEIYSIRILAGETRYTGEAKKWFQMGAMILGPLYTYAIEWVLNRMCEEKIEKIFPLMREGKFLSKLLSQAIMHRDNHIQITPLYVSRKAVYEALKYNVSEMDIINIFETVHYKVKDFFSFFDIDDCIGEFSKYIDNEIMELKLFIDGDTNVYASLLKYVTTPEMIKIINDRNIGKHKQIMNYFEKIGLVGNYATFDIGWNGRIPHGINKILSTTDGNAKGKNFFICGKTGSIKFIFEDTEIEGYVGTHAKNEDVIKELFAFILEIASMCDEGTTLGYDEDGQPITADLSENLREQYQKSICYLQEGILNFQKKYFEYKTPVIESVIGNERGLCQIISRLCTFPTIVEAGLLGNLIYEVNMGSDTTWPIIEKTCLDRFAESGITKFYNEQKGRSVEWMAGMLALRYPFFHLKNNYLARNEYYLFRQVEFVERIIALCPDSIVLVCAGTYGKQVYRLLQMSGKTDMVECFTDNNHVLQGRTLYGKNIKKITDACNSNTYAICTGQREIVEKLKKQIIHEKGETVILSCLD